jgi:hypothetical protein
MAISVHCEGFGADCLAVAARNTRFFFDDLQHHFMWCNLQGFAGGGGGAAGPRDFPVYVVSYFSTKSGNSFAAFSFRHLW